MRILYVLSKAVKNTGNYITVYRIAGLMKKKRIITKVISLHDEVNPEKTILLFKPDIIHTFHAYYSYNIIVLAKKLGIPVVLTITGTDVNSDLQKPERKESVLYCLRHAHTITLFHQNMKFFLPHSIKNIAVVPQSVHLTKSKKSCNNDFRVLLVSNIRSVKNNIFPIKPCQKLRKQIPHLTLEYIGKVLDHRYAQHFFKAIKNKSWITYHGEISHKNIADYYACVDVVLNTSFSEGGMANSLLEAMYLKIPVLASAVVGNKTIVKNRKTGLLYTDEESFKKAILQLYSDNKLRLRLTTNAYQQIIDRFNPSQECEGYLTVYYRLI